MSTPISPSSTTLKKYGLTVNDWYALFVWSDRRCPCCEKRFTRTRPPVIDHDHKTGYVRGLLCSPCNIAIGLQHDDHDWFLNVASYLLDQPVAEIALQGTGRYYDAPPAP